MSEQLSVFKLAFLPYLTMFPVKKELNPPPWGKSWSQGRSSRAARSAVFRENSKWWTKIHTRLTWVSRMKKVIQQLYWIITSFGFNWGQSCSATLVTKIAQKCLEILLLSYNLHILASDQKKVFVFSSNFWANFVTKSNFWLFFE